MDETPTAPAPVTARDIARILRRQAPIALFTFAATLAATLFLTSRMPRVYEAQASLLLDSVAPPSMAGGGAGGLFDLLTGGGGGATLETEVQKILSRDSLNEVIRRGGLKNTSPEDMRGRLQVAPGAGGQILLVGARCPTAQGAADMANWTARVYIDRSLQEFDDKTDLSKARLRRAAARALTEKQQTERALDGFMARVGISDPGVLFTAQTAKTMDVRNALDDARRSVTLQQNQLALYAQQLRTIPPTVIAGYGENKNPVLDGYDADVAALKAQRRVLLFDYRPDSDEVKAVDVQIAAKEQAIREAKARPYSVGGKSVSRNPDYSAAQTNFYNTAAGIKQTEKLIAVKEQQLAALEAEQKGLSHERTVYEDLRRARDGASEAYEKARLSLLQLDLSRVTSAPNVRFLDTAEVPNQPISPKPVLNAILAVALGLILGVGAALFAEYLRAGAPAEGEAGRPYLPEIEGLPQVGGVPVLGAVPVAALPAPVIYSAGKARTAAMAGAGEAEAALPLQPAPIEDALREVGYCLAHRNPGDRPPVVVLMGTRSDDSTAALAAHLAATLVRDGLRVTLVDADRAHPRLNRVFGKPDAPGVADLLADPAADPCSVLHVGAGGGLRFLAAGSPDNPALATPEGLGRVFRALAESGETDLVLVSGPAVWGVRAALPLEQAADGMVLVAPDDAPAAESVARARRLLSNGYRPRILGVVVGQSAAPVALVPASPAGGAAAGQEVTS